jgi:hypothetical protein
MRAKCIGDADDGSNVPGTNGEEDGDDDEEIRVGVVGRRDVVEGRKRRRGRKKRNRRFVRFGIHEDGVGRRERADDWIRVASDDTRSVRGDGGDVVRGVGYGFGGVYRARVV